MGAPQWVMLIVAVLTASGAVGTLWQKQRSEETDRALKAKHDARVEWWRSFSGQLSMPPASETSRVE